MEIIEVITEEEHNDLVSIYSEYVKEPIEFNTIVSADFIWYLSCFFHETRHYRQSIILKKYLLSKSNDNREKQIIEIALADDLLRQGHIDSALDIYYAFGHTNDEVLRLANYWKNNMAVALDRRDRLSDNIIGYVGPIFCIYRRYI
jgi:hypothetical protein